MASDEMYVDRVTASKLRSACSKLLIDYENMYLGLESLRVGEAFGTLQSGRDMARKFNDKAFGVTDSLESALKSHIAVLESMRRYFDECIEHYAVADAENAAALNRVFGR
ncbi:hypothetical protein ABH922_003478 [Rhodococcus sp. 27YEA15]|uniref:hypothetical protein n=1 Tax=Rhodococcus sp. 27YEA15 TaxID=3156259 RepID=UPI003C7D96AA